MRELANRVGVAYSNAHREVRLLLRMGVVRARRVGQALLCRWDRQSPLAKALDPLFARPPDEGSLFANLRRWGAPLARSGTLRKSLSLEQTLGHAVALSRRHPEVARAWPVVYAKNRAAVNREELARVAQALGQKRALGFLLTVTADLLQDRSLRQFALRLRDRRSHRVEDFFLLPRGDRARRLAEERTPAQGKRWLFRMNMPMDAFESLYRKFS